MLTQKMFFDMIDLCYENIDETKSQEYSMIPLQLESEVQCVGPEIESYVFFDGNKYANMEKEDMQISPQHYAFHLAFSVNLFISSMKIC
jgi:hypothetical protein